MGCVQGAGCVVVGGRSAARTENSFGPAKLKDVCFLAASCDGWVAVDDDHDDDDTFGTGHIYIYI